MANYIKSHSNYVLKSRHQDVKDGTIFERDITTIGGVSDFPNGQTPIYRSNNFIITVRNDGRYANQYNTSKWKANDSGDTWTLQTLSGMVSDFEDENDTKIVLKQDYYDFRDFAYYGSLTELFRASVTDILDNFPGELYVTSGHAYYTSAYTVDFNRIEETIPLGGGTLEEPTLYLVSNPFGIDIISKNLPNGAKPLRYFAEEGHKNFVIIEGDDDEGTPIENYEVKYYEPCDECSDITIKISNPPTRSKRGADENDEAKTYDENFRKIADITIDPGSITIHAYLDDKDRVVYLTEESNIGTHIRPDRKFLDKFFSECDNFQRLLVNEDTDYTATFSVIHEDENGYHRSFESMQFPLDEGGYNIDATNYGFNEYTKKMVQIGEYYDENFTDNLWRSMTHEAIKNFDWTYTREYEKGDEEEYVFGGKRIQKALRIFGREFDEIISYINNIRNVNRITYDERGNLPDYFLTDTVENEGWDVKLVYPYELKEFYYTDSGKTYLESGETYTEGDDKDCNGQLNNKHNGNDIVREFSQNSTNTIKPYTKEMLDEEIQDGYFILCSGGDGFVLCNYKESDKYKFASAKGSGGTYYDKSALGGIVKNRMKSYTDETEWTYQEVNNEFLKRLKLNSREILRHKGTVEGIEMILGMFGMKSKRWVEAHPEYIQKCRYYVPTQTGKLEWDFDVQEYTSFAERIEETWDVIHQNYRINWINSTKAITYDNRFISNYNPYGTSQDMMPYQGIPVAYREAYISQSATTDPYLSYGENQYYCDANNNKIIRRYLYPNFDKNEQLDGNPYYQMNGGWLSKTISGTTLWNFQFDVDDNIVFNKYVESGTVGTDGFIVDNHPLYKETIRNIRRVDNIASLLSVPTINLHNGIIYNVTNVETNAAIIDNVIYPITNEWYSGHVVSSVTFIKTDDFIKVGNNKFFDTDIIVYDIDGDEHQYSIEAMSDGRELKAYIIEEGDKKKFICKEDVDGNYSISNFQVLGDDESESAYTNYFVLDDINYADELAVFQEETSGWTSGWKRLSYTDSEYLSINTISNYYKGNNPHNGNMVYDNGHEYFTYFKRLFKHAIDNELFDERCYEDYYATLDEEIFNYGFSGLIDNNEDIMQYDSLLIEDNKIHYFGNYKVKDDEGKIDKVWIYGDDTYRISGTPEHEGGFDVIYSAETSGKSDSVKAYNLKDSWIEDTNPYSGHTSADEVTNQIVNNKIFDITFRLHTEDGKADSHWYDRKVQEELKYIDDIVMNYLTQMIPSTTILRVRYEMSDVVPSKKDNG